MTPKQDDKQRKDQVTVEGGAGGGDVPVVPSSDDLPDGSACASDGGGCGDGGGGDGGGGSGGGD